jgi:hypothetical protein
MPQQSRNSLSSREEPWGTPVAAVPPANMDRAGGSQAVAMQIGGHKTASVYRRYRLVDEDDMRQALARTFEAVACPTATVMPLRAAQEA